jgi:hypothetical protein
VEVVYNVLSHLERLSDSSFLWALFNRVNLKEYPALREIHKSLGTGNSFSHRPFAVKFYLNFFVYYLTNSYIYTIYEF